MICQNLWSVREPQRSALKVPANFSKGFNNKLLSLDSVCEQSRVYINLSMNVPLGSSRSRSLMWISRSSNPNWLRAEKLSWRRYGRVLMGPLRSHPNSWLTIRSNSWNVVKEILLDSPSDNNGPEESSQLGCPLHSEWTSPHGAFKIEGRAWRPTRSCKGILGGITWLWLSISRLWD